MRLETVDRFYWPWNQEPDLDEDTEDDDAQSQ